MAYCIQTKHLSFQFGDKSVLTDINLEVPFGSIYGFLGHNGAGKTTTIKLLLGLLHSSAESIFLFGQNIQQERVRILSRIGSLIEQPAIYYHLSGRENLLNRAQLINASTNRVEEMLKLVDLMESAHKKAGTYSLGMKQRLGIALALLGDPDLLILDEPTNGLDPNGILAIRHLLKDLTENHGKTVFLSSHLLSEVEKIATQVGIVHKGKMLFQGSIDQLAQSQKSDIVIEVDNIPAALELLQNKNFAAAVAAQKILLPYSSKAEMAVINKLLVENGVAVFALMHHRQDLENLFIDLIKE